ncbi:MAG: C40 family peptidase [Acidimicrobiia bacterium]
MNLRPRRLARAIGVALVASVLAPAALAQASPIDDKKAQAKRLQDQIDANYNQLETLSEQQNGAQYKLQQANQAIAAAQARVDSAKAETVRLHNILNGRAAALYMAAGAGLTGSPVDPRDEAARSRYAAAAASKDSATIDALKRAREELAVQQQDYEAVKAGAQQESERLKQSKLALERLNTKQQALLKQTQGELASLIQQEIARRQAEERRRAAAEQIRRQRAAAATRGGGGGRNAAVNVDYTHVPAPNPRAAAAVAFAQAQLGKPYQYAAAGPDAFDCSGLTMASWAAAGLSLPHYSGAQAAMFPRVPDDQIQPGDLVLYYGDLHHVAIAVNSGQAINAPHTGDFVKVEPIFRNGYRFAVRPG